MLQNIDWISQAKLTLDSRPKCFVGWMRHGLPACDAVQTLGDWCNCSAKWDEQVVAFEWQNTSYRMLSWNLDEFMINTKPTVPLLVQAFFNCKRSTYLFRVAIIRQRNSTELRDITRRLQQGLERFLLLPIAECLARYLGRRSVATRQPRLGIHTTAAHRRPRDVVDQPGPQL